MLTEIHRIVILSIFVHTYIYAQDVQNIGVNLNVENDPFASPGVDPFGNVKSGTGSSKTIKTSKSSSTTHVAARKETNVQGLDKEPAVGAGDLNTINAEVSSIGAITSETKNVQSSGTTVSKENRRTDINTVKTSDTASSNSRSSSRRVPRKRNQTQKTKSDITTRRNRQRKNKNKSNQDVSRQSTSGTGTQSNTATNSKGQTISTRTSNTDTRNILRKDGAFSSSMDFTDEVRRNEQIGMEFDVPTTEKPVRYFRQLFADQRICEIQNCYSTDCYFEHPGDCRKYIRCTASAEGAGMEALEMNCAFGTFWSRMKNTCDTASNVVCPNDPCRDRTLKSYPSGLNCRSYWTCVNGRSDAECCPANEAYVNGVCQPSDSCKIDESECPYKLRGDMPEKKKKNSCPFEKHPKDESLYVLKYYGTVMNCATGTRFDEDQCTCVRALFKRIRCVPTTDIAFNGKRVISGRSYIEPSNVTLTERSGGRFNGRAAIAVPYFKSNQNIERHLVVRMRFYHNGKEGYDSQVLISNCKTVSSNELSPSFAILLSKTKNQIIFFISTKQGSTDKSGGTASISLPYTPGSWTVVEMKFINQQLNATVQTFQADGSSTQVNDVKDLKGRIKPSVEPVMVGNCNMNDGFVGYIDEVKIYLCDPYEA
ncbi:uncharacterized protein LOC127730438 [Mytilus californianus]|uniref:uncharacterized protein LOC127730438 n=1 Tax=Mytilus californianus TaxID=6549 RepID=UPI002247F1E6|nr:uncharacterized protein LOC127730438 [Mytilus californianus]XP_052094818.1 uncharacterized protein LOC127730438 [Mytilus californianus]